MTASLFPAADPTGTYSALYQRSLDDPQGFWAEEARRIDWFTPFEQVLDDRKPPFARWFVGGARICATTQWIGTPRAGPTPLR